MSGDETKPNDAELMEALLEYAMTSETHRHLMVENNWMGIDDPALCKGCTHKETNNDPELHCYMFREFQMGCKIYSVVER